MNAYYVKAMKNYSQFGQCGLSFDFSCEVCVCVVLAKEQKKYMCPFWAVTGKLSYVQVRVLTC